MSHDIIQIELIFNLVFYRGKQNICDALSCLTPGSFALLKVSFLSRKSEEVDWKFLYTAAQVLLQQENVEIFMRLVDEGIYSMAHQDGH